MFASLLVLLSAGFIGCAVLFLYVGCFDVLYFVCLVAVSYCFCCLCFLCVCYLYSEFVYVFVWGRGLMYCCWFSCFVDCLLFYYVCFALVLGFVPCLLFWLMCFVDFR